MKRILIISIVWLLSTGIKGQEVVKDGFKIYKTYLDGHLWLNFEEISDSYTYPFPQGSKHEFLEFMGADFDSRDILDSLERSIFTKREIDLVNSKYKCLATYTISTVDGRIVKVTYAFFPRNSNALSYTEIDPIKLKAYSRKIKENITFVVRFSNDIKTHGFITQCSRVFISARNP